MQYSIVNYRAIPIESSIFRLDSEFFHPQILAAKNTIRTQNNITLRKAKAKIIHPTEIKREYTKQGIQILLAQNIRDNFLDFSVEVFMPYEVEQSLLRNRLKIGDLVLTRSGANYGQCAVYLGTPSKIFACADDLVIRTKEISTTYLSTFLNTDFGKLLIESCKYGGSQPHIAPQTLYDIPIYIPSAIFIEFIDNNIKNSLELIKQSEFVYHQAQTLLLSELGLLDWRPKHRLSFFKNYSETEQAGRFDAEYFQPKYEKIVKAIKNYKGGWDTLGNQFKQNKKGFSKDDEKEYNYLEIGGINISSGEIEVLKLLGKELPSNAKIRLSKDDIIVSKVRTYRGAVAIIECNNIVGSGAFTVLRETGEIKKETLFVLLKSLPYLEFSLKFNTGTSYPVIVDGDILTYPLPLIKNSIQNQIQRKIGESFTLRKQSKHLLECAKKAVEMAIEKNEKTAVNWIKQQAEKLKI